MTLNQNNKKHLIYISYDAFSEDNWEMASRLPNLSILLKNGAYSTKLKSVYPTLTYVVHSTIVTGVYPDKHGIFHNNPFQPFVNEKSQSWFWYKKDIKVPAIYDVLKAHNMKTAGILWPVTGKADINYNMPEIRAIGNENQALKILKNGSVFFNIGMEMKFGKFRRGIEEPYLDDFTAMCAADTIKRKKPNLVMMHFIELDDAKHRYGTDSKEAKQAILRMDTRIGKIMRAATEAGIKDNTTFIVAGDHGQIDIKYKVRLNKLLKDNGLIYFENNQMKWRAYVQGAGGSAYLHIKTGDKDAEKLSIEVLENAMHEGKYGIEHIYGRKELDNFHVDSSVPFMLEAKMGYCFDDDFAGPEISNLEDEGIKYANHGYSPDKPGYRCVFVVSGNQIKNEYQLGEIEMVDIAPTMGRILGIDFPKCDGRLLNEIFRD